MYSAQAEQNHGDLLLCVHRDTRVVLVPNSMIAQVVWLMQLVMRVGAVFALHAGQSGHPKLSGRWWLATQRSADVQVCHVS